MNVMGGMFKDKKKWGNHPKQFASGGHKKKLALMVTRLGKTIKIVKKTGLTVETCMSLQTLIWGVIVYGQKKKKKNLQHNILLMHIFGAILHQFAKKKTLMLTQQRISHVVEIIVTTQRTT